MELLFVSIFLLGMSAGGALVTYILGPDPDLRGEWHPGDEPRWRR